MKRSDLIDLMLVYAAAWALTFLLGRIVWELLKAGGIVR
jgi:hypothetical protein